MEKLTYGLIGCGRIAPNHITAAMNNADALEVVALCDPVREHAEKILSFLPEEKRASVRMYEDYREMLRDGAPTLVSIATESGKHASIGLDCLDAGCNVIIEKPIALSMDAARALGSKAKEKNVKLCVNHQNRFNKAFRCGRRPFRPNAARHGSHSVEPWRRILRPSALARHLGAGWRLSDESVHPQHRPTALDDG